MRHDDIRAAVPQLLTACRLVLGTAALIAALDGRLVRAATLITIGGVFDGLDGMAARRLGVSSRFGAMFDYFADYMCFIIAPWALARALLAGGRGPLEEAVTGLPLLTGAIRYARNGSLLVGHIAHAEADAPDVGDLPGLGTVFFAFICVAAVFLDAEALVGKPGFSAILRGFVVAFSLLMIAPVRYPKVTRFTGMSPTVLVLLAVMPFVATRFLAAAMLILGLLYAAVAPFFARRAP